MQKLYTEDWDLEKASFLPYSDSPELRRVAKAQEALYNLTKRIKAGVATPQPGGPQDEEFRPEGLPELVQRGASTEVLSVSLSVSLSVTLSVSVCDSVCVSDSVCD